MARKSPGGVYAKGADRIEFVFFSKGKRYRPTVLRTPSAANLRRAHLQLIDIRARIKAGMFDFAEEFPDYRVIDTLEEVRRTKERKQEEARQQEAERRLARSRLLTCNHVFDAFLTHCETRMAMNDIAYSTAHGYRQILDSVWRPQIGGDVFEEIRYSRLASIAAAHTKKKKSYNNIVSALRCAFDFGYKDHPEKRNPASGLNTLRITKKDRQPIDPFTIQEGEAIIALSHVEFGPAHGNYEEFRFFTGLRQSEEIALKVSDCDLANGKIRITHVHVRRREKDRTKTGEDREIALCPRAFEVLPLRQAMAARGRIDHEFVFFQEDGTPIIDISYPYKRWRHVVAKAQVRYREPYNAALLDLLDLLDLLAPDGRHERAARREGRWPQHPDDAQHLRALDGRGDGVRHRHDQAGYGALPDSGVRHGPLESSGSPRNCHQKGGGEGLAGEKPGKSVA